MNKYTRPLLLFFIIINALAVVGKAQLLSFNIKNEVVIVANLLLFAFTLTSLLMQLKAAGNTNPNAIVRAVMIGMGMKLVGFAVALLVYLSVVGKDRSVNAVYVSLGLYFIYTWIEVRIFLKQNPKKNAQS